MSEIHEKKNSSLLTDDVEVDKVAHVWRGRNLAFVDPTVSMLWVLDLQRPVFAMWMMDRPEPLI